MKQTIKELAAQVAAFRQSELSAETLAKLALLACDATQYVVGDVALCGVYRGGDALIVASAVKHRPIHLFDTGTGLPDGCLQPYERSIEGRYKDTNPAAILRLLEGKQNVELHLGRFPDTAVAVEKARFCLVNVDFGTFEGTLAALTFFWPRLNTNGFVAVQRMHDALDIGVRLAFDTYFAKRAGQFQEFEYANAFVVARKVKHVADNPAERPA